MFCDISSDLDSKFFEKSFEKLIKEFLLFTSSSSFLTI
jgi:hypothetical protein